MPMLTCAIGFSGLCGRIFRQTLTAKINVEVDTIATYFLYSRGHGLVLSMRVISRSKYHRAFFKSSNSFVGSFSLARQMYLMALPRQKFLFHEAVTTFTFLCNLITCLEGSQFELRLQVRERLLTDDVRPILHLSVCLSFAKLDGHDHIAANAHHHPVVV